jgi:hypothetical protein
MIAFHLLNNTACFLYNLYYTKGKYIFLPELCVPYSRFLLDSTLSIGNRLHLIYNIYHQVKLTCKKLTSIF